MKEDESFIMKFIIKKFILSLIILIIVILAAGGLFYWQWQNQKDVRDLNKTLPKGISVEKSLFGQGYKIINKIDGYKFKIPKEWKGLTTIQYTPEKTEKEYTLSSIELEGKEGIGRIIGINHFKISNSEVNLQNWVKSALEASSLTIDVDEDEINGSEIIKTKEPIGLIGYIYFFRKNSTVYSISGGSEESIRNIITNGKW